MGLQDAVYWGLGTEDDPEDLTGRDVQVVLNPGRTDQTRHTPTVDPLEGGIYFTPPLLTDSTRYLLLVAETPGGRLDPAVRGEITPGDRVRP